MLVIYSVFFEREVGAADLDTVSSDRFKFSDGINNGPTHNAIKRTVDIAVSLSLLVFFIPLILGTAIAIRLESPGPIMIRQRRVGYMGKSFLLYKFRSMRADAEQDVIPKWATEIEPRVTVIGSFIRRFRIDEIPQILNVLKGDMSFVGPRPEHPFIVEQRAKLIPYYTARHRVKPGITGWAQLNYWYDESNNDAKESAKYDLYYVKNNSIFMDLAIIIKTIRVILWPKGVR